MIVVVTGIDVFLQTFSTEVMQKRNPLFREEKR